MTSRKQGLVWSQPSLRKRKQQQNGSAQEQTEPGSVAPGFLPRDAEASRDPWRKGKGAKAQNDRRAKEGQKGRGAKPTSAVDGNWAQLKAALSSQVSAKTKEWRTKLKQEKLKEKGGEAGAGAGSGFGIGAREGEGDAGRVKSASAFNEGAGGGIATESIGVGMPAANKGGRDHGEFRGTIKDGKPRKDCASPSHDFSVYPEGHADVASRRGAAAEQRDEGEAALMGASTPTGGDTRECTGGVPGELTRIVAMDCEMVGVGYDGRRSVLARVSLVNSRGSVIYDKFVRPLESVKDYRTAVSGVRRSNLSKANAEDFWTVQREVAEILKGRLLVGHALKNDFKALLLSHPRRMIRDTQKYKPYRTGKGKARSLKSLAQEVLGMSVQEGEHSSVEDAGAALLLYKRCRASWEKSLRSKGKGQGGVEQQQ